MVLMRATDPLVRLAVALAIGLLIGLERGWEQRDLPEGGRIAGFRTFGLIGLLGGVATMLPGQWSLAVPVAFAGVAILTAIGYWRQSTDEHHLGYTTEVAALVTFALGVLAGFGRFENASSAAVVVALLLSFKPEMHGFLRWIDREELLATFRLLLISIVLLPILPDRGYGPWQALNPYHLWWMVVLVAVISYLGYFAIKSLGANRGVLLTGLLGGLVSSTAVSVTLSRRAATEPSTETPAASGIVAASAMMFPRMLAIIAPVAPALLAPLSWPLMSAGIVGGAIAAWYERRAIGAVETGGAALELRNPVDLRIALEFGLMLAVIMVAARGITATAGDRGLYVVAAASGLVDVDAISLTVAAMLTRGEIAPAVATVAILIPAAVNTVVKPALVFIISGARLGTRVAIPLLLALAAGAAALWLSHPM
jgi:uncharacterized membrane protein (DUF4010 family)